MITPEEKIQMKTLASLMNKLKEKGYAYDFSIKNGALVMSGKVDQYQPEQVRIIDFYRFEGESDPSDNAILFGVELSTGERGLLVDAYGTYSDDDVSQFVNKVEEIHKMRGNNSPTEEE